MITRFLACAGVSVMLAQAGVAKAEEAPDATTKPVNLSVVYTADAMSVPGRNGGRVGTLLDNLDVIADVDLARTVGWRGATLHAYVLNNAGDAPNDRAATLQGVDNIEVSSHHVRVFELWVEQSIGNDAASLRGGLYNLNSEFYANESAGGLLAPPFGIGSELAATGPNGPSIFPSTALGLRLNVNFTPKTYGRVAVLNAHAGVLGDPEGVDFSFTDGLLGVAEFGVTGPLKLSGGAWRYSQKQDDIRELDGHSDPVRRSAQGAYLLAEAQLFGADGKSAGDGFLRIGISDGQTTSFRGGWQAGVRLQRLFASRPDGVWTIGVQQGVLSDRFRDNLRDFGVAPKSAESGFEITYSDHLTKRVTLQPDLQWVRRADADATNRRPVIVGLRLKVDLSPK